MQTAAMSPTYPESDSTLSRHPTDVAVPVVMGVAGSGSQFAALEPPAPDEDAVTVSIHRPVPAIVDDVVTALSSQRMTILVPA
jgi:hypothetical protein